jgi:hypothetical protein
LLAAALAPALVFAAFGGSYRLLTIGFLVALAHAVLLGLPSYLLARSKGWVNIASAVIAGFCIGAIPVGVLTFPLDSGKSNVWVGGVQTIVDGLPTTAGWVEYLKGLLLFGGYGLLGGLAFWATLRIARQPSRMRSVSLVVVPVLAVAALAAPALMKDRSCHNMLRDGRSSISAVVRMDVQVEHQDWPALAALLQAFAASQGLSFRDSSKDTPDVVRTLYVSACDQGVNIEIAEQLWAHSGYKHALGERGIAIGVYAQQNDTDWRRLARPLVETLEKRFPGRIRFRGDRGELVSEPPFPRKPN